LQCAMVYLPKNDWVILDKGKCLDSYSSSMVSHMGNIL
jgi:hypothetical protein